MDLPRVLYLEQKSNEKADLLRVWAKCRSFTESGVWYSRACGTRVILKLVTN